MICSAGAELAVEEQRVAATTAGGSAFSVATCAAALAAFAVSPTMR